MSTTMMTIADPAKAKQFFEDKIAFTTGPVELDREIRERKVNVIDVRAAEDYTQGHIPSAVNVPKEKWDNPTGLSRDKVNVVYCYTQSCHLAANAAVEFAEKGFPVMELEGGFATWKDHGLRVEK